MAVLPLYRAILRRQVPVLPHSGLRPKQPPSAGQKRRQSTNSDKPQPVREDPIPVPNTVPTLPTTPGPFWYERLGPVTRVAQAYGRSQRKRPYITQLCTSLVIYLCADCSAQQISGKDYDPERTGRSLIIGAISSIPSYKWFLFLSHNFNYSSRLLSLGTKIIINQTVFTPIFNTYFFGMQSFLAGDNFAEIWDRVTRTVPTSIKNSLKLWPAVTAVNFTFIPIEYRSIFAGVVAVGWQTYLTYLNRLAEEEEARARPGGRIPPSSIKSAVAAA